MPGRLRRHYPDLYESKRKAETALANVQREHPEATLVGLRRRADGRWAACISISIAGRLAGFRGLEIREGETPARCHRWPD